jgi:hypothetical protein
MSKLAYFLGGSAAYIASGYGQGLMDDESDPEDSKGGAS